MSSLIGDFYHIISSTLRNVTPDFIFKEKIRLSSSFIEFTDRSFDLRAYEKIIVIGFGKASSAMATELEKYIGDRITEGVVVTKYGFKTSTKKIRVYEAGHPILDENTIKFSNEIIQLLSTTSEKDLVICLISGGGSSLFEVPDDPICLNELQLLNEFLIKQDIPIHKVNFYRKAFSKVKGGKFLSYIYPATCISLIISDVVGDDLSIIASGPTYINTDLSSPTLKGNFNSKIILSNKLSLDHLNDFICERKFENEIIEYFNSKVYNIILASNYDAIKIASSEIENLGYEIDTIENNVSDTVENISKFISNLIEKISQIEKPFRKALLLGGETFLKVKGTGLGGRNMHLVLKILNDIVTKNIDNNLNFLVASVSTDGNDGPTDAAGAFITNEILKNLRTTSTEISPYLENYNSYNFFKQFNTLVRTGTTNTNVADIIIGLFEK